MHSALYPLGNGGDGKQVGAVLDQDFQQLSQRFTYVRTYHSQFFGFNVADYAKKYGLKLYLGIAHYSNADWNELEIKAAVDGAKNNPDTVEAIIVGNEDLDLTGGDQSVDAIITKIQSIKDRLRQAGVPDGQVAVGTAQRINGWLGDRKGDLDRLAGACDFIGVHIYPFFTQGFDVSKPLALLDAQWDQMLTCYGSSKSKLRLTETGWPSDGDAPSGFPANKPSSTNQKAYFQALSGWSARDAGGPHFWFMAYDRRSDDPFLSSHQNYEQHFGFFTADNKDKGVF
ncbi:TPA: hypothetical protein N0F65_000236 [Lagenidium giganteum]|uniref:glucan endo-1,3-beta-D-glucosidase n=1 Tax=Lagenidium giganteum TaxID=4803 RepID=A0AAV2YA19_9STRA|nr:TPA: hypothetical protein N0F65_000236 [Lagenidium giganteum]